RNATTCLFREVSAASGNVFQGRNSGAGETNSASGLLSVLGQSTKSSETALGNRDSAEVTVATKQPSYRCSSGQSRLTRGGSGSGLCAGRSRWRVACHSSCSGNSNADHFATRPLLGRSEPLPFQPQRYCEASLVW